MHPLRRKITTSKLVQAAGHVHSPTFMEIIDLYPFFFLFGDLFDDLSQYLKEMFRKPGTDNSEFVEFQLRFEHKYEEDVKDDAEIRLLKIEEDWESILYGLIIRNFVLLIQSFIRKYILLPSLIITKNIIRILLFQNPEWSEDFRDWSREVHIKCTYQGIPVSHKELPKNWFDEGIQIRILYPFVLKPWHKSKVQSTKNKIKNPQKPPKRGGLESIFDSRSPIYIVFLLHFYLNK
ncbi:Ycf1 domain protein [Medicago truncatula]|uniref:Ycf1 domain protein n=1 Tax=Medicago truncatula TaxID=3880 RepID=G7LAW7_MEDTR|nr:Ycf1 domain protein [Medicago truncatula]